METLTSKWADRRTMISLEHYFDWRHMQPAVAKEAHAAPSHGRWGSVYVHLKNPCAIMA